MYGSDIRHHTYVTMRLYRSERHRSLSRNWYHSSKPMFEIAMSEAQWAAFVSSFNIGGGVPVTLQWKAEDGPIPRIAPDDAKKVFKSEIADSLKEARSAVEETRRAVADDLVKMPAATRKKVLGMLDSLDAKFASNLPFIARQLDEHVDGVVEQAKASVHAHITHTLMMAGAEAMGFNTSNLLEGPKNVEADDS